MAQPWYNHIILGLLHSPFHRLLGKSTIALQVRGAKSGKRYTLPVNYIRDGDDLLITSMRSRTWWRNLRLLPTVQLTLHGKSYIATAHLFETPADVQHFLQHLFHLAPTYARYFGVDSTSQATLANPEKLTAIANQRIGIRLTNLHHTSTTDK